MKNTGQFYFFSGSILASLSASSVAMAQVIPDNTLPDNSVVTSQDNLINIEEGTRLGNQLFHSFEQFSVPEGNTALFNNALDIQNIFSRVTGGTISNIDGIIEANGSANLFLINPNGIIFGPNASLNIGGSFLSSTANSIIFADGNEFSAVNPQSQPLLSINTPIGLGLGEVPSSIVHRSLVGLEVPVGETLALIGGDVFLEGGDLTAPEGRIELGSVAGNEVVSLTPVESGWQVDYEEIQVFQDISLSNMAVVNTSGERGGAIQIQGRNVNLSADSEVFSDTFGAGAGETIRIIASESIDMSGDLTRIATNSFDTGTAGDLVIETEKLTISKGAFIVTEGFGESSLGNLTVKASESVELLGTTSDGAFSSGLFATVFDNAIGEGKAIAVETEKLIIRDGAAIFSANLSTNRSADINIAATESIELLGASANGRLPSGLFAQIRRGATGDGGILTIETGKLIVQDGARVSTSTFGGGQAGNLNVNASESVELIGTGNNLNASGLFAQVATGATGDGGELNIETAQLLVTDGAQVSTVTLGIGKAGNLNVNASQSVELIGIEIEDLNPSGLFARVNSGATGDGGALNVETANLTILGGAQISSAALEGEGGTLTINATDSIFVSGTSELGDASGRSGIFVTADLGATRSPGKFNLNTKVLTVEQGAEISANNFGIAEASSTNTLNVKRLIIQSGGQVGAGSLLGPEPISNERGSGGTLNVNASESIEIVGTGTIGTTPVNSSLFTRAEGTGNAGDLNIVTPNLTVAESGNIDVSATGTGEAGSLTINAQEITLSNGSLTAETRRGDQGNIIIDRANSLILRNNSQITTNATEEATGGNITITSDVIALLEDSDITANAVEGRGGNIQITTQGLFQAPDSEITASSEFGIDGDVNINEQDIDPAEGLENLPTSVIDSEALIANSCVVRSNKNNGTFLITGKAGLPYRPGDAVSSRYSAVEVQPVPNDSSSTKPHRRWKIGDPIIEPTGVYLLENGQRILSRECEK